MGHPPDADVSAARQVPDLLLVRPGSLVIEAILLKYSVMAARSLALGLLLLLCVTPVGWAAEPVGATVVLQLPPSMSPDAVKGLIADLAAKGAQPAEHPADPPPASGPTLMTGMKLTAQIWAATKQAMRAVPVLAETPQIWVQRVEAEGGTRDAAFRFWAIALAGLVAAPLIGLGMRALFDRRPVIEPKLAPRLRAAFIQLLVAAAGLTAFAFLFCTALLPVSMGRPLLAETTDRLVWAAAMEAVDRALDDRPVAASLGPAAAGDRRWRRTCLFALVRGLSDGCPFQLLPDLADRAAWFWTGSRIRCGRELGARHYLLQGGDVLGDSPADRAGDLAATGGEPGPVRRAVAASWHWFFIALALCIFFGAGVEFALGKGAWVARASTATQGIIVALAVVGQASHNLIARVCACDAKDTRLTLRRARCTVP